MRRRTIASLKEDARKLLPDTSLEQVYALRTSMRVHDRWQHPPFQTETEVRVGARAIDDGIESWAKYTTSAHSSSDDDDLKSQVWTAVVECVAVFELPATITPTDDQLEAFALLVGTPVLHPYAREWTQTLTSHSQYPAFTLGMLDSLAEQDPETVVELPDHGDRHD